MDGETSRHNDGSKPVPLPGQSRLTYLNKSHRLQTLFYSAIAVLAALIPVILFTGYWAKQDLDHNRAEFNAFMHSENADLAQRIDIFIGQQISALQAIASLPSLDEPDLQVFHGTATRMAEALPQWVVVSLLDPATGKLIINTMRPLGEELPLSTAPELVRRVAREQVPGVQTRYHNEGGIYDSQDAVFLYVPVIRNGQTRVILSAGIQTTDIQHIISNRHPLGLSNTVIDENGRILGSSDGSRQPVGRKAEQLPRVKYDNLSPSDASYGKAGNSTFHVSSLTRWTIITTASSTDLPDRPVWSLVTAGTLSLTLAGILGVFLLSNILQKRLGDERLAASKALSDLNSKLLATTREALAEQKKAASEREVLLREIYHRVKNNLQIVQSLLRLGARDLTVDQREPFEMAVRRIGAMAQIHTLLYTSPDLTSVDFKEYLERILSEMALGFGAEYRHISTDLEAQSMRIPLDTAIPLAFIVVEIVTNAYKHAFPDGRRGEIHVRATSNGGSGTLVISDNGVGFPETPPRKRSLGINLITKLSGQIGGELTAPQAGSNEYHLVFPLNGRKPDTAPSVDGMQDPP